MIRKTNSTKQDWTKTAKNEYTHINNHKVTKTAQGWVVSGPNRNDGFAYTTMREAMYAAAKTPQVWVGQ
jgi:hypothetical protein